MEMRIQKLEEFAEAARAEFRSIDVRLTRIEASVAELRSTVTSDVGALKSTMTSDFGALKSTMTSDFAELRSSVKADLVELNASVIKWIVGTVLAAGAVAISVMTFVLNHAVAKPVPPAPPAPRAAQHAPINISISPVPAPVAPAAK